MSTFLSIGDRIIINLDRIAYVEDATGWAIDDGENTPDGTPIYRYLIVAFSAAAASSFAEEKPDPLSISLLNQDADNFIAALMRRTEVW